MKKLCFILLTALLSATSLKSAEVNFDVFELFSNATSQNEVEENLKNREFLREIKDLVYSKASSPRKDFSAGAKIYTDSEYALMYVGKGGITGAEILIDIIKNDRVGRNNSLNTHALNVLGENRTSIARAYLLELVNNKSKENFCRDRAIRVVCKNIGIFDKAQQEDIYKLLIDEVNDAITENSNILVKEACVSGLMYFIGKDSRLVLQNLKDELEAKSGADAKNQKDSQILMRAINRSLQILEIHHEPVPPGVIKLN